MSDTPASSSDGQADLRRKALLVRERLCAVYECPVPYFHHLDPLSELVSSLLSHRTRNADAGRAFQALRARYPDWAAVRDAPAADVQAQVGCCTWPELSSSCAPWKTSATSRTSKPRTASTRPCSNF